MQTASATGNPATCNMPQRDATENEAYFNWHEHARACRGSRNKRERVGRGSGSGKGKGQSLVEGQEECRGEGGPA